MRKSNKKVCSSYEFEIKCHIISNIYNKMCIDLDTDITRTLVNMSKPNVVKLSRHFKHFSPFLKCHSAALRWMQTQKHKNNNKTNADRISQMYLCGTYRLLTHSDWISMRSTATTTTTANTFLKKCEWMCKKCKQQLVSSEYCEMSIAFMTFDDTIRNWA